MQRGFSFIEFLCVSLIIGLIAVTALPVMGNLVAAQELQVAARHLVADLRYLQQMTLNQSEPLPYRILFYVDRYYLNNGVKVMKTVVLPPSVTISGPPSPVTFSLDHGGSPTAKTIQLSSTKLNKALYVKIHPNRGRVRIDVNPGAD